MARRLDARAPDFAGRLRGAAARPSAKPRRMSRPPCARIIAEVRARGRRGADRRLTAQIRSRHADAPKRCASRPAEIDAAERAMHDRTRSARSMSRPRASRTITAANCPRMRASPMTAGAIAWLALDGARQRRPLCAGRHRLLSQLGADERGAGQGGGREPHRHGDAGQRRRDQSADAGRRQARRRLRDLSRRRGAGRGRAGLRHRDHRAGGQDRGPGQCLCRRGQARGLRPRSASIPSPGRRRFSSSPIVANDPDWIAADLLSQAEHDASSQAILITDDADFADKVDDAVDRALALLPRKEIAGPSWRDYGAIIMVAKLEDAAALSDRIAPEHLEIATADPEALLKQGAPCRRDLPRPPHARGDGRLHRRSQPCAADVAHGALFVGPFGAGFPEAHHASRPARPAPSPRSAPTPSRWPKPKGSMPMPAPSRRGSIAAKAERWRTSRHRASPPSSSTKRTVVRRTREIEQEREIAIYDLLEANHFAPKEAPPRALRSGARRLREPARLRHPPRRRHGRAQGDAFAHAVPPHRSRITSWSAKAITRRSATRRPRRSRRSIWAAAGCTTRARIS